VWRRRRRRHRSHDNSSPDSRPGELKIILRYRESTIIQIKGQVVFKGGDNHKNAKIGWDYLNIFFLRTTKPEKLRFKHKLPNIVEIQLCTIYCPWGSCGATMGNFFYMCLYVFILGKNLLYNQQSNFCQTCYKSPFDRYCINQAPGRLQKGDNHKNAKIGGAI
jgi:5-methylcytosine-specific restriction endonuclease McrBC GTP-binding regulatory subunit McrB